MVNLLLVFICAGLTIYFKKREKRLVGRLQDMLDSVALGTFEDKYLAESGVSLLENSMWRYICDNRLSYMQLLEQKENLQKIVSDISHQAVIPVSNVILYSQLLEEELLLTNGTNNTRVQESINAILGQAGKIDFFLQMLVKLSRLEKGIITVKPEMQSIRNILQPLRQQYGLKVQQKNIIK